MAQQNYVIGCIVHMIPYNTPSWVCMFYGMHSDNAITVEAREHIMHRPKASAMSGVLLTAHFLCNTLFNKV